MVGLGGWRERKPGLWEARSGAVAGRRSTPREGGTISHIRQVRKGGKLPRGLSRYKNFERMENVRGDNTQGGGPLNLF